MESEVASAVSYIVDHYQQPTCPGSLPSQVLTRSTASSLAEILEFPGNWIIDPSEFRKAVKTFAAEILRLQLIPILISDDESSLEASAPSKDTMATPVTPNLDRLVNKAVARATQTLCDKVTALRQRAQAPQPINQPVPLAIDSGSKEQWNASDIGYFNPHLDASYSEGEIVTVGKEIYYRNVYLFVKQVQDLASIKGDMLVKTNLNTALRGAAQSWYTAELSNLERSGLRSVANGVETWCFLLAARFKKPSGVALTKLTKQKYTIKDARNRREPASYVQTIEIGRAHV